MSTAVEINGVSLLPIKEAAKRVKYSRDYVARLAREGKIVASQVGRQWYVDPESLIRYNSDSKLVEELQKKSLSFERKREREAAARLKEVQIEMEVFVRRERSAAAMSTIAVLLVGLVTGGMIYSFGIFYTPVSELWSNNTAVVKPALVPATQVNTILPSVEDVRPTLIYRTEDEVLLTEEVIPLEDASGILLLARGRQMDTPAAVTELFSDPVRVEFVGETSGVVRYEGSEGEVVEVPFVRVPAANSSLIE